jgi:hypothetical protein
VLIGLVQMRKKATLLWSQRNESSDNIDHDGEIGTQAAQTTRTNAMLDIATTYRITNDENNRYIRNDNGNKVHQYISEHTMLSEQNTYALLQEISGLEIQDIYIYINIFFIRSMREIHSAKLQQMIYTM